MGIHLNMLPGDVIRGNTYTFTTDDAYTFVAKVIGWEGQATWDDRIIVRSNYTLLVEKSDGTRINLKRFQVFENQT